MLVNKLNDSQAALKDLAAVPSRGEPNEVHISLPLRPPAEPTEERGLARAEGFLVRLHGFSHQYREVSICRTPKIWLTLSSA